MSIPYKKFAAWMKEYDLLIDLMPQKRGKRFFVEFTLTKGDVVREYWFRSHRNALRFINNIIKHFNDNESSRSANTTSAKGSTRQRQEHLG